MNPTPFHGVQNSWYLYYCHLVLLYMNLILLLGLESLSILSLVSGFPKSYATREKELCPELFSSRPPYLHLVLLSSLTFYNEASTEFPKKDECDCKWLNLPNNMTGL